MILGQRAGRRRETSEGWKALQTEVIKFGGQAYTFEPAGERPLHHHVAGR